MALKPHKCNSVVFFWLSFAQLFKYESILINVAWRLQVCAIDEFFADQKTIDTHTMAHTRNER